MPRKQWDACRATVAGILCTSALGLTGCGTFSPARIEMQPVERRDLSRDQLLAMLDGQSKLLRFSATTRVSILEEGSVIPATVMDALRKEHGKPYQKRFTEADVNGSFFLSRDAQGHVNVSMSGEVQGINGVGFTLLGKDRSFWMLIPTSQEERDKAVTQGQSAPNGKVLYGTFEADTLRPKDRYSIRPQDFADLMLTGEARLALNGQDICYVEKWQDYYVMNFLRPDWPNHIYSKIWFDRQNLRVAIHQLFDSAGELVAEARFKDYGRYPMAKDPKVRMEIPVQVEFLWPRDRILMRALFADVKLNDDIPAKRFDEKRFEGYPTELIEAPPAR
ncbi:MAG: hypothetical protein ABSA67_08310 [Candidatus Brocadiia bacterium]|jgi:hypothetical protein